MLGAARGVGSILVQLARQLTGITVIGTAANLRRAHAAVESGSSIDKTVLVGF